MQYNKVHQICKSGCLHTPHTSLVDGVTSSVTFCCKLGAGKYKRQHSQYLKSIKKGIKFNFTPIDLTNQFNSQDKSCQQCKHHNSIKNSCTHPYGNLCIDNNFYQKK